MKKFLSSLLLVACWVALRPLYAQQQYIGGIQLSGNHKTKDRIILRELTFKLGDTITYAALRTKLADSKQNIFNTTLFNSVSCTVQDTTAAALQVIITVKERWYFYPIPVVELADRNFNVWWVEKKHDPQRLNAGVFLIKRNLRGRNETMTTIFELGYTNYISLQYDFPFIDKKMRKGLQLYSSFYSNKESAYITENNKQLFLRDDDHFVKQRFQTGAIFRYRKEIHVRHNLELNYTTYAITDTLMKANPEYLLGGKKFQQFGLVRYLIELDYRDVRSYPLNGYYFTGQFTRWGLTPWDNVNLTELTCQVSKYTPIRNRIFLLQSLKFKTSAPDPQPYNLARSLGYLNDYVRGYEYYVIDGAHFAILRNEIKYCLVKKKLTSFSDKFDNLPFNIYVKGFVDLGYVKDNFFFRKNPLNNDLLAGYGLGADIVTFYDLVFRYELTTNRLKETRLYFSLRAMI